MTSSDVNTQSQDKGAIPKPTLEAIYNKFQCIQVFEKLKPGEVTKLRRFIEATHSEISRNTNTNLYVREERKVKNLTLEKGQREQLRAMLRDQRIQKLEKFQPENSFYTYQPAAAKGEGTNKDPQYPIQNLVQIKRRQAPFPGEDGVVQGLLFSREESRERTHSENPYSRNNAVKPAVQRYASENKQNNAHEISLPVISRPRMDSEQIFSVSLSFSRSPERQDLGHNLSQISPIPLFISLSL